MSETETITRSLAGRRLTIGDLKVSPRLMAALPAAPPNRPASPTAPARATPRPVEAPKVAAHAPAKVKTPRPIAEKPPARQPRELTASQRMHREKRLKYEADLIAHDAEVKALRALLCSTWPAVFCRPPRPLKIGIDRDIVAAIGCESALLYLTLANWCAHPDYLRALRCGAARLGLDGAECGAVTAKQQRAKRSKVETIIEGGAVP